jgi:hypothetical protein
MKKYTLVIAAIVIIILALIFAGPNHKDKEKIFVLENKEIQCPAGQKGFDLVNNSDYTVDQVTFRVFVNVNNSKTLTYWLSSITLNNRDHIMNTFLQKKGIKPFCDRISLAILPKDYKNPKFYTEIQSVDFNVNNRKRTVQ